MSVIPKTKFMWLLIAVMAYAYYQDHADKKKHALQAAKIAAAANKDEVKKDIQPKEEKTITNAVIEKISQNETGKVIVDAIIKNSLEKRYGNTELNIIAAQESGSISIVDSLKGEGAQLNCGARAVINYDAFNSHGMKFDTTIKDKKVPVAILVGGGQMIKGLEAGIVGMKEGGRRKITIPSRLAFDESGFENSLVGKGETVIYDVELVEVKDGPYKSSEKVITINENPGDVNKLLCGDKANIKYSFSSPNGEPIPGESGELSFIIGEGKVPVGIEESVIGMGVGSSKTIHIPYALIKTVKQSIMPNTVKFTENTDMRATIEVVDGAQN